MIQWYFILFYSRDHVIYLFIYFISFLLSLYLRSFADFIGDNYCIVAHLQSCFVHDCVQGDSRFLPRIFARTKQKHANKKHFTDAVLSTKFHARPSSHRKARPHIRFLQHPL